MIEKSKIKNQKSKSLLSKNAGQVVLLLVLITVVGLTIGLSLISRTVTDVRISSQIEQSGRAFSAAEAGIESALKGTIGEVNEGKVTLPGASATYNIQTLGGNTNVYTFSLTEVGSVQTVWLAEHKENGDLDEDGTTYPTNASLDICWGSDTTSRPAVLVSLYYKEGTSYKVAKAAYDSLFGRGNNFYVADTSGGPFCDGIYRFKKTITATASPENGFGINSSAKLLALRIQPLYASTAIAVKPSGNLPVQGKVINSVGETGTGIVRKIQVYQGYPVLPALLDFTLFSED